MRREEEHNNDSTEQRNNSQSLEGAIQYSTEEKERDIPSRGKSKVGEIPTERMEYNEEEWVVSIINTGGYVFGGPHAKLVVEGLERKSTSIHSKLFIGEYHIFESNQLQQTGGCVPPALINVKGKAIVLANKYIDYGVNIRLKKQQLKSKLSSGTIDKKTYTHELNEEIKRLIREVQPDRLKQYATSSSVSILIPKTDVKRMVSSILREKFLVDSGQLIIPFQYAGNERSGSEGKGHNCISWCKEKLRVAGVLIDNHHLDKLKSVPEKNIRKPLIRSNHEVRVRRIGSACHVS